MWGLVPAMVTILLPRLGDRLIWPLRRFENLYSRFGLAPLVIFSTIWALFASFQRGDPAPLSYVPVANPLELTQLFVLTSSLFWLKQHVPLSTKPRPWYGWAAIAFVVLNGMIARTTHYFGNVPFEASALLHSPQFQAALSIIWTLLALIVMVKASRALQRTFWVLGLTLLGVVIIKLFAVDLKDVGTVTRIISFIGVGLLTLLIGYLSPIPPRSQASA